MAGRRHPQTTDGFEIMPRFLFAFLLALCCALAAGSARAQTGALTATGSPSAPSVPDAMSPGEVRDAVSRLSDQQVRQLLLERLDAVAAERERTARRSMTDEIAGLAAGVAGSVLDAAGSLPDLLTVQGRAFAAFYEMRGASGTAAFLGLAALSLLGGLAAGWLTYRLAGRWRHRIAEAAGDRGLKETLKVLTLRLLLDASGLILLAIVSGLILDATMNEADRPFGRLILTYLAILPMGAAALSRFLIAPRRPELRLVRTDDRTARILYRHLILLALLIGFQFAMLNFSTRNGIPVDDLKLGFWLTLATLAYIAFIAWDTREGLVTMLRGGDDDLSPLEAKAIASYPYAMIVFSGLTWLLVECLAYLEQLHLIVGGSHYLTLALLGAVPVLDTTIRGVVRHAVPPMTGEGRLAERAYRSALRSYVQIGRLLVFCLFVFLMVEIWEIDFLASAGIGAQAAARLIEVLLVLGAGFLAFELTTLWIDRRLAGEQTDAGFDPDEPGGGEGGGVGGSRLSTVLPLVRWVLRSAIVAVTVLIALGNVGIDITPLLAGAGIIGLAIGFGGQKLVSDVVSGIFFLVDDAFRTGEYLDIDGTVGTVERISIRSLRLRHHRGAIHTIPFGDIPRITNYSRDWVIMKLKFTVPFDTDLKKVKNIFKKIGADLMQVPELAGDFIQPFKSQGVMEVDDVGIVVRGKYMAKPGRQFMIRKEVYNRVQQEFEANGIQFARREVRVKVNEGEDPKAAAAAAVEQPLPPAQA